jgi:hypothetical protein
MAAINQVIAVKKGPAEFSAGIFESMVSIVARLGDVRFIWDLTSPGQIRIEQFFCRIWIQ